MNNKKNIILLIVVILIFFIAFEIILRIFSYPVYGFSKGLFQTNDIIGYKLSSNYSGVQSIYGRTIKIETNSKGMRDFREYSYKRINKPRILILGDSFSFGNSIELNESYVEYLRKNFNDNVEILNLAVPGYGVNNEYLSFINEDINYKPDVIILQFAINDWDSYKIIKQSGKEVIDKSNSFIANKDGYLVNEGEGTLRSIHLFLLTKLRFYSFIYSKSRLSLSSILNTFSKKNVPLHYFKEDSKEYQEAYNAYHLLLEKIKNNTQAKIIVFVGPSKEDFVKAEEIKEKYKLNYSIDTSQVKNSIKKITESLNLTFIEIKADKPEIFLKVDGHWTPEENKKIANELYKSLKNEI
ncbi:MAG: SGNH/GDSL hydrolase family protein [Candidatus Woesearchaeota archaeon]